MQIGSPMVPDVKGATAEAAIQSIVDALNRNSNKLFTAFINQIDFKNNLQGTYYSQTVRHNVESYYSHKLGYVASNILLLGGDAIANGLVTSPGRVSSGVTFQLPTTTVLSGTGTTSLYVADPSKFMVGMEIVVGTTEVVIQSILGNLIVVSTTCSGTDLQTLMYLKEATLIFFIF